jgi:heme-degrading monooxygenase HmoA
VTDVLEHALLEVIPGQEHAFEAAFATAQAIIAAMDGYIWHRLERCIEQPNRYLLLVKWQSLEAHTEGFRGSAEYQRWKALLHHFYDPFPTVMHFQTTRPHG